MNTFSRKKITAIFRPTVCKPGIGMQGSRERRYCDFDFYGNSVIFFVCFNVELCLHSPTDASLTWQF